MAIKFYGGHQLNSKAKVYGTRQDFEVIEVDENGNVVSTTSSNSNDVSLLIDASGTADGSVIDTSSNSHPITVNGNVSQSSFSPYRSGGYSWEFDGNSDSITFDSSSDLRLDGDFTVEFWINNDTITQDVQHPSPITFPNTSGQIYTNSSNNFYGLYYGSGDIVTTGNNSAQTGVWQHVAFTRSGTTCYAFVDGVLKNTATSSQVIGSSAGTFRIGSYNGTGGDVDGKLSDVRIIKGTAAYTADFTPPTERLTEVSGTSLLTCNLPYLQSGLTAHGDVSPVAAGPYDAEAYSESLHGGSYVFDGSSSLTLSSQMHVSGEFAIEAWVHLDDNYASSVYVCGTLEGSTSNVQVLRIKEGYPYFTNRNHQGFGNVTAGIIEDGGLRGNTLLQSGQWYHLALTRDTNNTLRIFVNGQVDASATWSYDFHFNTIGALNSSLGHLQGSMSDFRVVLNTPVYTEAFTPSTAPLAAVDGTSLLLSGNNAAIRDESQTAEKLTVHGSISPVDSSPYGSGKSMGFNGSYITSSEGIDFSDNDFTIELWWYPTSTGRQGLFHGSYGADWSIGIDYNSTYNNPTIGFWASSTGGSWDIANADPGGNGVTAGSPIQNAWNHIAYVRNGSTLTLYLNGVNVGEVTGVTAPIHSKTNTHQQTIGTWWKATGWGGGPMSGNVADYRISLEAVYTADFDVPTAPFDGDTPEVSSQVSLHLNGTDSGIVDSSSNSHAVTISGDTAVAEGSPYDPTGPQSLSFDGNGDYIRADEALDSFTSTTDSFTIEFWMRPERFNDGSAVDIPFAINSISTGSNELILVGNNNGAPSGQGQYVTLSGSGANPSYSLGLNLQDNGPWYHIAMTYDGTTFKLYVDGTVAISQNVAFTIPFADCSLLIGADADSANAGSLGNYYKGRLADIRIVKSNVVYTENFTVPSAPLTAVAGTRLLVSDLSDTSLSVNGNVSVVSDSPYANTSMSFDGNGDYLSMPKFDLGSDPFTVEFWMNVSNENAVVVGSHLQNLSTGWYISYNSSVIYWSNFNNGNGNDDQWGVSHGLSTMTGQWHHIAVAKDSSNTMRMFLNGVMIGSKTDNGNYVNSPSEIFVGAVPNVDSGLPVGELNGLISDLRIIQGTALYTADFTVPTSALTTDAGSQVAFAELSTTDVKTSYPPVINGLSVSASNSQDTWSHGRATMSFTSGKYYWEAIPTGPGLIGFELDTADGNRTYHNAGTDTLSARSYNGGMIFKDGVKVIQGQTGWTDGDVVGIAVDGDTGDVQFYVNGVAQAGMSINTGWGSDKVKIPSYGVYKNGASNFSWLFNFGASGFAHTPPAGYQALSGTETITPSLLISGNKTISDASPSSHSLTLNGDVTTATGFPYAAALGKSITFDGNGDFAHISNADFSYGTGDFTIEAWINSDDVTASGPRNIFTQRSQGGPVLRLWNSKLHYMRGEGQNALYSAENLLTAGQWHHVALVRSSGVVSIYLDGTSVASQAETYDFSSLTEVYVGSYGSQYEFFDGEIADFRITKAAVYTENFSVPTATLGDYPPPPVRYYKTLATPYVAPSYDPAGSWSPSLGNGDNMFDGNLSTAAGGVHLVGYPSGSDRWTYTFDTPVTVASSFRIHATIGAGAGSAAAATEIFVINGVDGSQLAKDQNAYHSGSNPSVWIDMTSIIENGTLTTIAMKPVNGVSNPGIMAIEVDGQILTV